MQYHLLIYFDPKEVFSGSPEANALLAEIGPHLASSGLQPRQPCRACRVHRVSALARIVLPAHTEEGCP